MPKGINNKKWWVIFAPDHGMGAIPMEIGPFPCEAWALGWAFMEMKDYPLSWWYVKKLNRKG